MSAPHGVGAGGTLLQFVQTAEHMESRNAVLASFLTCLAPIGVRFLIYVTTDRARQDRYLWSNIGIHEHPDARNFLDPFLDYCCSSYSATYTGVAFLEDYPYLGEREQDFIRAAGTQGFTAGLGLPVALEGRARFGGFNLGTGLSKADFIDKFKPLESKLAHACVLLNRTLEALPRHASSAVPSDAAETLAPVSDLTKRERDILFLLSRGHARKDIARITALTPNTVNSYIRDLYAKMGVSNRAQATRAALQMGLQAPRL